MSHCGPVLNDLQTSTGPRTRGLGRPAFGLFLCLISVFWVSTLMTHCSLVWLLFGHTLRSEVTYPTVRQRNIASTILLILKCVYTAAPTPTSLKIYIPTVDELPGTILGRKLAPAFHWVPGETWRQGLTRRLSSRAFLLSFVRLRDYQARRALKPANSHPSTESRGCPEPRGAPLSSEQLCGGGLDEGRDDASEEAGEQRQKSERQSDCRLSVVPMTFS